MKKVKFYSKLKQERILAKISYLNYLTVYLKKIKEFEKFKFVESYKLKYSIKVLHEISSYIKNMEEIVNVVSTKNNLEDKKKYTKILNDVLDFDLVLTATMESVKNGEVVPFEELSEKIKNGVDYEFSTDIYVNLKGFFDLGDDISYLYYRTRFVDCDIPLFITKELKEKYRKYFKEKTGDEPLEFGKVAVIPDFRKIYDYRRKENAKKLYESVFPEFDFKYEDREPETMNIITLDFPK